MKLISYFSLLLISASALLAGEVEVYYSGPGISKEESEGYSGIVNNSRDTLSDNIKLDNPQGNDHLLKVNDEGITFNSKAKTVGPLRFSMYKLRFPFNFATCTLNGSTDTSGKIPTKKDGKILKRINLNLTAEKHEHLYLGKCTADAVYAWR